MNPRIKLHPAARAEFSEAIQWYAAQSLPVAQDFFAEVTSSLEKIAEAPKRFPVWSHGTRRFLLRRFPYRIIYRDDSDHVQVYTISHTSREPHHWIARVTG